MRGTESTMASMDLTREWLQNVLRPYASRDRILPEVLDILQQRRTLAVKTDAFTFDTGHTALLLLLHGTLPITYRGATYHIPIHLWIPLDYPRSPPLAFVVPTKEMAVRKGREVEPGGRVREEIVQTWWNGWQDKTLEMLLRQLTSVFSAAPPVYARPPEQAAAASSSPRSTPRPQYEQPRSPSQAGPSQQPPPPPARPSFGPQNGHPESLPQYRSSPGPPNPYSGGPQRPQQQPQPQGPPPVPQLPQRPYISMPHHPPGSQQSASPSSSLRPNQPNSPQRQMSLPQQQTPYPPQQFGHPPHQQAIQQQNTGMSDRAIPPQQGYPNQGYGQHSNGYQPTPPNIQRPPPLPPQAQSSVQNQPQRSLQPQQRTMEDLLSSPGQTSDGLPDATSPPPLPPSKPPPPSLLHLHSILLPHLSASLPPLIHSLQAGRQHMLERKEDLESGEPAIKDEMARLEAVKKVCDSVGRKMDDVVAKGAERVADLENRGEISVDEVVCGISIVHNQLVDLVAEDNAIEDTIYHLTRALETERIDLDRFLKSIRSLAREQYIKRALIEKILHSMGQKQGW